jgi:hypothetical protein
MKPFVELECNNITMISQEIYNFLKEKTDIIETAKPGWHFINCADLLLQSPELLNWFKQMKLIPRHSAVTIVVDNNSLPLHIDELPVIAKINMPVINTSGWANRWYVDNILVAELLDMSLPVVFNSQIFHSVEKTTAITIPRIAASFTFHNEPVGLLK